jgi:Arc/MetJ-type ribon-helix-helix transcriptional regulator
MNAVMAERIRLIIDTEDVIRRAVQLRKVKSGAGESVSDIVNAILREALAEEIKELEEHAASEDRKRKKGGKPQKEESSES